MPKLILRCNYLKNAPASHLSNFVNYIGTREGVEKVSDTTAQLPATAKQQELITDILQKIEDASKLHEYYDYIQKPTRENASEFITQALEYNMDIIAKKKNYMDYLANRPRVERIGTHGLFSYEEESVVLPKVQEEVANHQGVIWTNVVSLRREDAERLGYDNVTQWQELVRSRVQLLAENYKIDSTHLKWYAAFHNESHHPHIHLVVYSSQSSEGYLTKQGIDRIRSTLAHDIFRQDFMSIYEQKTKQRDQVKEQAENSLLILLEQMRNGVCHNEKIAEQMQLLSVRLQNTGGKKVYGYLKADVKAIVNGIVDELAKDTLVSQTYGKWLDCQYEITRTYKDAREEQLPLSQQKEFKSIKNSIIRHAMQIAQGDFYTDDEGCQELEEQTEAEHFTEELLQNEQEINLTVDEMPEDIQSEEIQFHDMADELPHIETDSHYQAQNLPSDTREEFDIETTADIGLNTELNSERETESNYHQSYYADWNDTYKEARTYLYGTDDTEPDLEAAYEIMKEEAENGNALALYDAGRMHQQGLYVPPNEETAQEWYREALQAFQYTEQKKAKAYLEYRIGKMHQYGHGTEQDFEKAAAWFQTAVGKKHKYAMYSLGMLYYRGEGVEQSDETAFRLFKMSHEKTNAYASYELAKMYEKGIGTTLNPERAKDCYRIAFLGFLQMEKKSKDDKLMYRIGCMYLKGIGTEMDEKKAEVYLKKASEYGNAHARYQLAKLYIKQESEKLEEHPEQAPDYPKIRQAVDWLAESADGGNQFAAYALGKLHADGILVAKDIEKATHYLTIAAEEGNEFAQYRLGKLYLTEEPVDIGKAVHYLRLAANQQNEYAAYRLGKLFLEGILVEKNVQEAIANLNIAADNGNQFAQFVLGKLYLMGKEVAQDKEKAWDYFTRSAEQGNIYAQFFLDHWNELYHPDLALMATRLLHQLEQVFTDQMAGRKGNRGITESKLRRRIREKKIAQGHAADDHEAIQDYQQQY